MQNIITKLIGLLCLLIATHVVAQNNTNNCYQDLLQRGDQARKNQQYRTAIQKYTAARECDGANGEVLSKRILQVFDDIEKLKQQAEANEKTAEAAQKAAKKAEIEKINALQKKVKSDSISIILNAKNKILQVANDSVALLIEKAKQKISQQVEKQKRTTQLANNLLQAQIIAEDDPTLAYNILSQTIEEDSLNDA
ncbi:MAG TPA: hypothetical protein PKH93_09060, partial [Chitinophagales bacterium]|nr:hypothetical protein [Chitinophagales bacterium]